MSIKLDELDREVGLAPLQRVQDTEAPVLPYWERMIEESVARQGLCLAGHVTPKGIHALLRGQHATLSHLSQGQLDRAIAKAAGTASITQPAMLGLIIKSWGM